MMDTMWWTAEQAGRIGGYLGSGVGVLGGLFGAACGLLLPKGRGFGLLVVGLWAMAVLGLGLALAGGYAAVSRQPYHVFYPLLLVGGVLLFSAGPMLLLLRKLRGVIEQRRLAAEEFRRGTGR